jgi:DNA-binding transcriptional regulator YdaS (Cro superfamily)
MKLSEYIEAKEIKYCPWAKSIGIPATVITTFLQGKRGLSFRTAAKIVRATGGLVTFEDLLPPEKGNGRPEESDPGAPESQEEAAG